MRPRGKATGMTAARRQGGHGAAANDAGATATASIEQQIRERAYGYFVERGGAHGHELDDWLRAEAQLRPPGDGAPTSGVAADA